MAASLEIAKWSEKEMFSQDWVKLWKLASKTTPETLQ